MEGLNNISEIVSLELNQVEIMDMLENISNQIEDFKSIIVILFGFVIGYIVLKDFINNIFRWWNMDLFYEGLKHGLIVGGIAVMLSNGIRLGLKMINKFK